MKIKLHITQRTGATAKHPGFFTLKLDVDELMFDNITRGLANARLRGDMMTLETDDGTKVSFWADDVFKLETSG